MKGGSAHAVPLTPEISALLESLPKFSGGDFLFSTTGGQRPVSGFSKAKARLDGLMRKELGAQGLPLSRSLFTISGAHAERDFLRSR